jgi:TROVE domain
MARINTSSRKPKIYTHEGGKAKIINPEFQLRRSVMSCMLWEKSFYEDGVEIADRISELVAAVKPEIVAAMAVEAREKMKLRHVPLLLVRMLAGHKYPKTGDVLCSVIQRVDELAEFVSIYWKDGKEPLSAQVKKGLARAFQKFDEYALAKYNRDTDVKLRDVLFLCHAKPKDEVQASLWKRLVDGSLAVPDTWEVALSAGKDKRATWERLLREEKLGALALLRNLRNMGQVSVSEELVRESLSKMRVDRVLPFRFIAASRYAPFLEPELEGAMFRSLSGHGRLSGKTVILVDVSGSMEEKLSGKSDMTRLDAACGVAMVARELCDVVEVYTFSNEIRAVPSRRGFGLRDVIVRSQSHGGTYLGAAVNHINAKVVCDRLIVITDEQAHDDVADPVGRGYMLNVGVDKNGVGYGKWVHIDGFSEAVVDYILAFEAENAK